MAFSGGGFFLGLGAGESAAAGVIRFLLRPKINTCISELTGAFYLQFWISKKQTENFKAQKKGFKQAFLPVLLRTLQNFSSFRKVMDKRKMKCHLLPLTYGSWQSFENG